MQTMQKILLNEPCTDVFSQYQAYLARYGFNAEQLSDPLNWSLYDDAVVAIIDGQDQRVQQHIVAIRAHFQGGLVVSTPVYDDAQHIMNLELGADDVVTKQEKPRMLAARLNALIRRLQPNTSLAQQERISVGAMVIDVQNRSCMLGNSTISLTSHEFDLLLILAKNAGKVVDRNVLFETVLGRPYDGLGRSIDVRISRLRRKLFDNETTPEKIKTIWKQGYCLVPGAF
jgi:DNA-binding response OmpR family regulator